VNIKAVFRKYQKGKIEQEKIFFSSSSLKQKNLYFTSSRSFSKKLDPLFIAIKIIENAWPKTEEQKNKKPFLPDLFQHFPLKFK